MSPFEEARLKYKPSSIRFLLIAEAPPTQDRFFYFEDVRTHDHLFIETMKVLYLDFPTNRIDRSRKPEFLTRFQADGFYLVDAVPMPLTGPQRGVKREVIRQYLPDLTKQISTLVNDRTWTILISVPVYDVCLAALRRAGVSIANQCPIEFPSSHWQRQFRMRLGETLKRCGWADPEHPDKNF